VPCSRGLCRLFSYLFSTHVHIFATCRLTPRRHPAYPTKQVCNFEPINREWPPGAPGRDADGARCYQRRARRHARGRAREGQPRHRRRATRAHPKPLARLSVDHPEKAASTHGLRARGSIPAQPAATQGGVQRSTVVPETPSQCTDSPSRVVGTLVEIGCGVAVLRRCGGRGCTTTARGTCLMLNVCALAAMAGNWR
jgi:hypothetical protein